MIRKSAIAKAVKDVIHQTGSTVVGGPFKGMAINPQATSWGGGDIATKLLGVYEQELHETVSSIISMTPARIVNVGHAEGYYAVGLARACPSSEVIAVDICHKAKSAMLENAKLNNVTVHAADAPPMALSGDVWVIDIEGDEAALLENSEVWGGVYILVELHSTADLSAESLAAAFSRTHDIRLIGSGSRNPHQFDFLSHYRDDVKWLLMSENRLGRMTWAWMSPKC
jgi:hypothetical protein